jgi:SpoVK/Ycf46/Vps4 family AAA+-type ATPase
MVEDFRLNFLNRLDAGFSMFGVITSEIHRATETLRKITKNSSRSCKVWTTTEGWETGKPSDPLEALEQLKKLPPEGVYIINTPKYFLTPKNPFVIQTLVDIIPELKKTGKHLVFLGPEIDPPAEIKETVTILDFPLPTETEIQDIIVNLLPGCSLEKSVLQKAAKELCGLGAEAAEDAASLSLIETDSLASRTITEKIIPVLQREKAATIKREGLLEVSQPDPNFSKIGGLDRFKLWAWEVGGTFTEEAVAANVEPPGGVLLLGLSGTGKTRAGKYLANILNCQFLQLDFGKVYGRFVGESESRIRKVFKQAEAMKRAILFIDEMEKGLSTGQGDSGTSTRVMGTVLQWMQDKRYRKDVQILVVATANNVATLPPELLRPGRFDVMFWFDLPEQKEREEILRIHLASRNQNPDDFGIESLAGVCEGFTGAEIEEGVRRAMRRAFLKKVPLDNSHLVDVFGDIVPMSVSRSEEISSLRNAWKDVATPASTPIQAVSTGENAPREQIRRKLRGW